MAINHFFDSKALWVFLKQQAIWLFLFAVLLFVHIRFIGYIYDDAYIHFRIAEHLLDYSAPYYNLTDRFMSSSSSVWTILLSVLYFLFGKHYIYSVAFLNASLLIINIKLFQAAIVHHLGNRLTTIEQILFVILFIAVSLPSSVGLMETGLALFFSGLSLLYLQKNRAAGFAFLSLALFVRLELAILYLLFTLFYLHKNGHKSIVRIMGYSLLGSVPFAIYDLYFFGTLVPLTVRAKSIVYDVDTLVQLGHIFSYLQVLALTALFLWIITVIKNQGFRYTVASLTPLTVYAVGGVLLLGAYTAKGTFLHGWYYPLFLLPVMIGLFACAVGAPKKIHFLVFAAVFLLFEPFIADATRIALYGVTGKKVYIPHFDSTARVRQYLAISKELYETYPDEILMTSEIGAVGYGFEGYILDGMGLIQDDCLKYHPMSVPEERSSGGIGAIPAGCVDEKMPGIILSYDIFIQSLSKNEILKKYIHYKKPVLRKEDLDVSGDAKVWGSKQLNVYIRKDIDREI